MKRPPTHGGYRPGAGRKPGSGSFGKATVSVRIPQSRVSAVRTYLDQCRQGRRASLPAANDELILPLIGRVAAGQPIDADAHVEREIAVDRFLFRPRPDYLLRVHGPPSSCRTWHWTPSAARGPIKPHRLR